MPSANSAPVRDALERRSALGAIVARSSRSPPTRANGPAALAGRDAVIHLARAPDGARRVAQVAVPSRDPAGLVTMEVAVRVDRDLTVHEGPALGRLLDRLEEAVGDP